MEITSKKNAILHSPRSLPTISSSPRAPLCNTGSLKILKDPVGAVSADEPIRSQAPKILGKEDASKSMHDDAFSRFGDMSISSGKTSQESELASLRTGKSSLSSKSKSTASSLSMSKEAQQQLRSSIIDEDRQIRDKFYGVKTSEQEAVAKEQFVDPFTQQYRPYAGRRRRRLNGNSSDEPRLGPGVVSVFRSSALAVASAAAATAAAASAVGVLGAGSVCAEDSIASFGSRSLANNTFEVRAAQTGTCADYGVGVSSGDSVYSSSDSVHSAHSLYPPHIQRRPSSAQGSVNSRGSARFRQPMGSPVHAASPSFSIVDDEHRRPSSRSQIYRKVAMAPIDAPLPSVDVLGGGALVDRRAVAVAARQGKQSAAAYTYSADSPQQCRSGPGAALYSIENAAYGGAPEQRALAGRIGSSNSSCCSGSGSGGVSQDGSFSPHMGGI